MWSLSPAEVEALGLSVRVAAWSTAAGLPLAVAAAHVLARRDFWGKEVLNALLHMPLVLPPVVTGYLLLLLLGRRGFVGAWLEQTFGLVFAFRWTGAVVAAAVVAFPLMVRPIRLSLEAVDPRLESAAKTLGANRFWAWLTVTLPLSLPGIVVGAILGFTRSLGEFGATVTFVSNIPGETQTLSLAVYSALQVPGGEPGAMRLTVIIVVVTIVALVASEMLGRYVARRTRGYASA
ncbi:MAG: molybdate ABC transporter permease subunit [Deltaproteobacteria bacterium]|nr:molybdate ABC transporter permease subunit [Deltaproteobacteria bacterium]MDE0342195.1 molybdate ABC transporter permease subunit [Deltaproteobacteria bacterium]